MSEAVEGERTLSGRLRVAVVRLNRRLRAQSDSTVTLSQLSTLACLSKCGALSPRDLAAKEGVQPPSMTRMIAALEGAGLVARRQHPTDGRQAIVELTDEGQRHIEAERHARERWLEMRLAEISEEERETVSRAVEILERMAAR